eukprot:Gb_09009 [translate_table: standard]
MWALLLITLFLSAILWVHIVRRPKGRGIRRRAALPPGSMGLPIVGESFQFFAPSTSFDVPPFILERKLKYGAVFKTRLVGRPVVVSTDPDVNQFIFQQEGRLFQSWYPESFTKVFGDQNVGSLHGYMYKYLRNMVLTLVGRENLKEKFLPEIQQNLLDKISNWHDQVVDMKEASATIIFNFTAKKLIGYDSQTSSDGLMTNFQAFIEGLISFPLNIPGTAYSKCLKGRARAMAKLNKMLEERSANPHIKHDDFFDYVVSELNREGTLLSKEIALDLIFVLLFASFETTSLALTSAMKFLTDHPAALDRLTEEQDAILRNREEGISHLTWKEYKSMTFTFHVINETIRLANIVPGMFRKALEDVQIKGYTIPAGWNVMVCPTALHLDPVVYPDPVAFNPWRWESLPDSSTGKHFTPFGAGIRFCVGTDFTRLQMAVFLHCLVTNFRWTAVKGGEIVKTPGLAFPNGYHIHLHSKSEK